MATTPAASKGAPRGAHAKPQPLPTRTPDHVSDLMEPDLSTIRRNSAGDRAQMESRTAEGKGLVAAVLAQPTALEALSSTQGLVGEDQAHELMVGHTYRVPIHMLQDSEFNARVFYAADEIDGMALSLQNNGQDVALSGFVEGSKVTVVDGSKRLRAARAASLDSLRVEIREKPASNKELYKASRRMNIERSTQTPLDDASRFQALLQAGDYPDQTALGADMGCSQTVVSQTLSLNRIPQGVMRVMREETSPAGRPLGSLPKMCQLSFAVEIAKMFDGTHTEGQEQEDRAIEVIREIVAKDLSVKQARALVQSRLDGPKQRQKAETMAVRYGNGLGTLKVFAAKGQLDLSIKNVDPARIGELRSKIEQLFAAKTEP